MAAADERIAHTFNRGYIEHNRDVAKRLRDRGLYPDGSINTFLRTEGSSPG